MSIYLKKKLASLRVIKTSDCMFPDPDLKEIVRRGDEIKHSDAIL